MDEIRYPIGRLDLTGEVTKEVLEESISAIGQLPSLLKDALADLTLEQLDSSYREGGWTIKQVVHHMADAHLNAFIRFKLALTEDKPLVKTYIEDKWAELPDATAAPIEASLGIIEGLHCRWSILLKNMKDEDFLKEIQHPELGLVTLSKITKLYGWHSRHHLGHITAFSLRTT
jgi:uncharacterized damage-inducible protein DinB